MNFWILPSNEETFRLTDYLKVTNVVDWRQHNNFEVGDIVFMYNSQPYHRITHKMSVERVNVPSSEYLNDRQYWKDIKECEAALKKNRYVRLRLIATAPENSKLEFETLKKKGLKSSLQSAVKLIDRGLLYYIRTTIQPETKDKIARLCWNSNGWTRPSGREGKATSDTYEAKHGYGHEEWLLDKSKINSDGYHYAFLEPLRRNSFEGKKDIHLYTVTPEGRRQYIGCIHDAEYVSPDKADEIWSYYYAKGWIQSMMKDLENCGIKLNKPLSEKFNVRFKFENFDDFSDKDYYFRDDDPNLLNHRYVFLNKREPFLFESTSQPLSEASTPSVIDNNPESISDPNNLIPEGAKSRVTVNRYERNQEARLQCIKAKGCTCTVCGMNFEEVYGPIGKDFIHVHHIVPISEIGQSYEVNPVTDLVPVCPNCHAMLHHGKDGKVLTVEELKEILKANKKSAGFFGFFKSQYK